jgi:hypothetical protein
MRKSASFGSKAVFAPSIDRFSKAALSSIWEGETSGRSEDGCVHISEVPDSGCPLTYVCIPPPSVSRPHLPHKSLHRLGRVTVEDRAILMKGPPCSITFQLAVPFQRFPSSKPLFVNREASSCTRTLLLAADVGQSKSNWGCSSQPTPPQLLQQLISQNLEEHSRSVRTLVQTSYIVR